MAKLTINKLGVNKIKNIENKTITYNNQIIEIKQYLPIKEKLEFMTYVTKGVLDFNNAIDIKNPLALEIYFNLAIIEYYTNIEFTDKQQEEKDKLYDCLETNDIFSLVIQLIPSEEYEFLYKISQEMIDLIYNYRNSFLGILNTAANDYNAVDLDLKNIKAQLDDPNSFGLLKELAPLIGAQIN